MSQEPLLIIADRVTPRLHYACLLTFETLLGLRYELTTEDTGQRPCLHYTVGPPTSGGPWLQACEWLAQETPPPKDWTAPKAPLAGQFFPTHHSQSLMAYDVLASIAWLGMLGPLISPNEGELDAHGRSTYCLAKPMAHHMAIDLSNALGLTPHHRSSTWELTLDVDQPWLHAHKGFG